MSKVRTRKGAVLLWRLGDLNFSPQDRWSRAPESRGLWAFPWPYFESYLAYHKYLDLLPKKLQSTKCGYPASSEWYEDSDGRTPPKVEFDEDGRPIDPELQVKEGWSDARDEWVKTVGRKVLPMRKFWYTGELYSHINHRGEIGNTGLLYDEDTDWHLLSSRVFADVVRKTSGNRGYHVLGNGKGVVPFRYSSDHLEVFIPAGRGKIHNFRD